MARAAEVYASCVIKMGSARLADVEFSEAKAPGKILKRNPEGVLIRARRKWLFLF